MINVAAVLGRMQKAASIGLLAGMYAIPCATHAAAQSRPDLSGVWTAAPERIEVPKSDPRAPSGGGGAAFQSGDMGSGWGSPITVVHRTVGLTVEYPFFTAYDLQPPLKFVFALDGSESLNIVRMGRGVQEFRSTAAWVGNALVITTRSTFQNPRDGKLVSAEIRQALSLVSPTSLAVEATRVGVLGGPTTTTRTMYSKR